MKKILAICAVVGWVVTGVSVWAEEGGGKGCPGRPGDGMKGFARGSCGAEWLLRNGEAAKELGITDDQITQLKEAMYQSEMQGIKARADLEIAQMELGRLLESAKPATEAVDKAIDKISGLEAQLQKNRVRQLLKAREILGEETVKKIRGAMEDHRQKQMTARSSERHERRGGRHALGACEDRSVPPPPARPQDKDDDEDEVDD